MVGDGENDVQAGLNVGCKTALIGSNNLKSDVVIDTLLEFVDMYMR
jgi:phosphoglycolate phosphatase-like HAD superfamily hydrolase